MGVAVVTFTPTGEALRLPTIAFTSELFPRFTSPTTTIECDCCLLDAFVKARLLRSSYPYWRSILLVIAVKSWFARFSMSLRSASGTVLLGGFTTLHFRGKRGSFIHHSEKWTEL